MTHRSPVPSRREVLAHLIAATATMAAAAGCRSHEAPEDRTACFLAAVARGDLATVDRFLGRDPALAAARDARGRSAFVLACLGGHEAIATRLRAEGLELDVVEAVLAADWDRVEALAAADPSAMNRAHPLGGGPLHAGAIAGSMELHRLRSLGCDPDGRPSGGNGFTPPRMAMEGPAARGAWLATTDLLGNGSDPNAAQRMGDSVLHGAVHRRDLRLVRLVLRKGGDPAHRDDAGRTPLDLARELAWDEGAHLLRDHDRIERDHRDLRFAFDADRRPFRFPDLSDVSRELQSEVTGRSHFDLAAVREHLARDPRLVGSISTDDELAIEACAHTGHRDLMRLHVDHGAPLSLSTAISLGDAAHARFLLDLDPLVIHDRGAHDFPVMWYAALGGGSVEMAELLLAHGAAVDQQSCGTTTLHQAARRGRTDLARFLIDRGARVDAVGHRFDPAGETPRQVAERFDHTPVARLLRDAGG